jgi:hypothetical protein
MRVRGGILSGLWTGSPLKLSRDSFSGNNYVNYMNRWTQFSLESSADYAPTVLKTHYGYQLGGFVVIKAQWLLNLSLS